MPTDRSYTNQELIQSKRTSGQWIGGMSIKTHRVGRNIPPWDRRDTKQEKIQSKSTYCQGVDGTQVRTHHGRKAYPAEGKVGHCSRRNQWETKSGQRVVGAQTKHKMLGSSIQPRYQRNTDRDIAQSKRRSG